MNYKKICENLIKKCRKYEFSLSSEFSGKEEWDFDEKKLRNCRASRRDMQDGNK